MKRNKDNTSAMSGHEFSMELLDGNDTQCIELLRMSRDSFVRLCEHFKAKGGSDEFSRERLVPLMEH
ncbi:hypothetical protein QVD17_21006 [Tagetes erecta]|uniref:DUF8040 domain-containing protein n=1 Tax=Tagetes erecta TaxID=13708 RepID=A0AAD8KQZ4_TARER|nr:hypothetical protein QVD17_21006 [Tagetes erecta]